MYLCRQYIGEYLSLFSSFLNFHFYSLAKIPITLLHDSYPKVLLSGSLPARIVIFCLQRSCSPGEETSYLLDWMLLSGRGSLTRSQLLSPDLESFSVSFSIELITLACQQSTFSILRNLSSAIFSSSYVPSSCSQRTRFFFLI